MTHNISSVEPFRHELSPDPRVGILSFAHRRNGEIKDQIRKLEVEKDMWEAVIVQQALCSGCGGNKKKWDMSNALQDGSGRVLVCCWSCGGTGQAEDQRIMAGEKS